MFYQRDTNYTQLSLIVHSMVSQDCLCHMFFALANSSFWVFFLVWEPHVGECIFKHWNHKRFVKLELSQYTGSSSGSVNNSSHLSSLGNCFVNVTTPTQFTRPRCLCFSTTLNFWPVSRYNVGNDCFTLPSSRTSHSLGWKAIATLLHFVDLVKSFCKSNIGPLWFECSYQQIEPP